MAKALEDVDIPSYERAAAVVLEKWPRRVRAIFNGEVVADSKNVQLMLERRRLPVYYLSDRGCTSRSPRANR
jgi:uncharacterized protein (DUF427 family)